MPEADLRKKLQNKIFNQDCEYYLATRAVKENGVFESRYYYFTEYELMYHDRKEEIYVMPCKKIRESLSETPQVVSEIEPLYLDILEVSFADDRVVNKGMVEAAMDYLLQYFWSDLVEDFSNSTRYVIKRMTASQFLDIVELTSSNRALYMNRDESQN